MSLEKVKSVMEVPPEAPSKKEPSGESVDDDVEDIQQRKPM